jgi:hypothetical protein
MPNLDEFVDRYWFSLTPPMRGVVLFLLGVLLGLVF